MPRIRENKSRDRTKPEICKDVAHILSAELKWGTKYAVLDDVLWTWSEFDGKYDGCRYWSPAALRFKNYEKKLIHEHAVPKSEIIKIIIKRQHRSAAAVNRILSKYCVGVAITRDEDKKLNNLGLRVKMPDGWDKQDIRARHRAADIGWVDTKKKITTP